MGDTNLSIFTVPKPFEGEFDRIQTNAIRSWKALGAQVGLLGYESGLDVVGDELDVGYGRTLEYNEYGTPLLDSVFRVMDREAITDLVAFVNADIILFDDFTQAVDACAKELLHFLMVGQRTNLILSPMPPFERTPPNVLRTFAETTGVREGVGASDYFVFRHGDIAEFPPYALGAFRWDNALMARAINSGMALVDATEAVLAIHQNHAPRPRVEGDAELHANDKLVGENEGWLGRLTDATHTLDANFQLHEQVKA